MRASERQNQKHSGYSFTRAAACAANAGEAGVRVENSRSSELPDGITAINMRIQRAFRTFKIIGTRNVANLILARTVRRESELAVRAALGASAGTLRRTLLAESLLLCGSGAALGIALAPAMFSVLARYATRFSVRAFDLTLDSSVLWVGVGLALAASILLAFVPRLPSADASHGFGLTSGGLRITGATKRRLRVFTVVQIAASFVLLAGAGMLLRTLTALQAAQPGFQTAGILAVNVPVTSYGRTPEQIRGFYRQLQERLTSVPGVERVAVGSMVP